MILCSVCQPRKAIRYSSRVIRTYLKVGCSVEQSNGYVHLDTKLDPDQLPEWALIYFNKISEEEMKCNLCDGSLKVDDKSLAMLEHLKESHTDIYYLHKENPEATVGFRIEFLNLNMLKEDGDPKTQPILLGEVCEATTTEPDNILSKEEALLIPKAGEIVIKDSDMQYVLYEDKKKQNISVPRKRSWVWKYFDKLSNIIYRCRLCSVVLSIKGCNSNNMNRHVRTQHPTVFKSEVSKRDSEEKKVKSVILSSELDDQYVDKTEEICTSKGEYILGDLVESPSKKLRRSWIWSYFVRVSTTQAQCKLCKRHISHGGNATGNMNRHLKMIHRKTSCTYNKAWVWKVFDYTEVDYHSCKICQYKCKKFHDPEKDMTMILDHLKSEHGVVSGDQIITSNEVEGDEIE